MATTRRRTQRPYRLDREFLEKLTADLSLGECPCNHCMGSGCWECSRTGIDAASLKTIREHFAQALERVARLQGRTIVRLAKDLREA